MKLIKMIGLAAITAVAATAFMGASSASASSSTALCIVDQLPCAVGNRVSHVHLLDPAGLLLNDITGYVECISLFLGHVSNANLLATAPELLHLLGFHVYSSCEDESGRSCTATELNGPASTLILKLGLETAALTGEGEVLVRCGFFIHCVYNGEGLEGTLEGALAAGGTGLASVHNAVVNNVSGFLCPDTSELDTLFAALPSALYVSS